MDLKKNEIKNIPDYIKIVTKLVDEFSNEIVVFRGEDEVYQQPCRPNIFRKQSLSKSQFYEKQLFDSMRQNELSDSDNYLKNAIDAQHGEFPSRLLDVTYNCLIALYFAVTPYYHNEEDSKDTKDGRVYIFHFDKIYSASSKEVQEGYNTIINRDNRLLSDNMIFSKNHKFIDHCKANERIIAQQGAFILFQGDDAESIPAYLFSDIKIPANVKKKIRNDLKNLFGIHTGYVYPEIVNLVNDLSNKCKKIDSKDFSFNYEIANIENQFELEMEYYYHKIYSSDHKQRIEIARITEKVIYSYYLGIMQLGKYIEDKRNNVKNDAEIVKNYIDFVECYKELLQEFQQQIDEIGPDIIHTKDFIITVIPEKEDKK